MTSESNSNKIDIPTKTVDELARSIEEASDGSYAFLIGAGASRPEPAEIPTAGELIWKFQKEMYEQEHPDGVSAEEIEDNEITAWAKSYEAENNPNRDDNEEINEDNFSYGFWFSKARPTPGNRREEIRDLVKGKVPPFNQVILAAMMDKQIVSHTITPNFDNLLFDAFYRYTEERPFLVDHRAKAPQFGLASERPAIIKVHGDFQHYTQNTREETNELDPNMRDIVEQTIGENGLVVVGYGGEDNSIMSVLERETFGEFGVFWCKRQGSRLSDRARSLLESSENAYLVEIDGAESLLGTLWGSIDRAELPQPDNIIERAENRRERIERQKNKYIKTSEEAEHSISEEEDAGVKSRIWDATKLRSDGNVEQAIEILDNVINKYTKNGRAYYERGRTHFEAGNYQEALNDFNNAIDFGFTNSNVYNMRGAAKGEEGEPEAAIDDFDTAITLSDRDDVAYHSYKNRGMAKSELDEYEAAINDYDKAIDIRSENPQLYSERSEFQIIVGDYDQARQDAQKARSLSRTLQGKALNLLLELIASSLLGENTSELEDKYRTICEEEFMIEWSFEDLDSWLETGDLKADKRNNISEWVNLLREHKEN